MTEILGTTEPIETPVITHTFMFVVEDVDRHGNVRVYLRRPGLKKVRLHAMPGTEAFFAEYQAALATSEPNNAAQKVASGFGKPGTFKRLCQNYFASPEFAAFDVSTRTWRRRELELICQKHGEKPVAQLDAKGVLFLRNEFADRKGAANNRLKALKALYHWAFEAHEVASNPTLAVKRFRYDTNGHHTWTTEEVAQFENRHTVGSKARLAMALLLFTACRREDAPRLGPQHVKRGRIRFTQAKNEHRRPVVIDIPIAPQLQRVLDATPVSHLTFLVTDYGKPFSTAGFGNRMRGWCDEAGLQHCSAHGLRKAIAVMLAQSDATPHQIMAVTGHTSLEEVERYTREVNRTRLADEAIEKLSQGRWGTKVSHPELGLSVPPLKIPQNQR